jgi:hypothetical protein
MKKLRVFLPITKVDAEKRIVYGTVTAEVLDKSGEMLDYVSSKPFFESWSDGFKVATGGKSLGNLRVMHTSKACGKLTDLVFDDNEKRVECAAKVVDDAEWAKVEEGVYTGFSIGGRYVRRWEEEGVNKFTADPVEVSLVDNPAVPIATFTMVKAGGIEEQVAFKIWQPTNEEIATKATALAKAAKDQDWSKYIEPARLELVKEHEDEMELSVDHVRRILDSKEMDDDAKAAAVLAVAGEDPRESEEGFSSYKVRRILGDKETEGKKKIKLLRALIDEVDAPDVSNDTDLIDEAKDTPSKGDDEEDGAKKKADDADEENAEKSAAAELEKARSQIEQKWVTSDGKSFAKKADAVAHQGTVNTGGDKLTKALGDLESALTGEGKPEPLTLTKSAEPFNDPKSALIVLKKIHAICESDSLTKGIYDIGWLSRLLEEFTCAYECMRSEAAYEGDGSALHAKLKPLIAAFGEIVVEYAAEEVAEMLAALRPDLIGEVLTVDATADPEVSIVANANKSLATKVDELRKREKPAPVVDFAKTFPGLTVEAVQKALGEADQLRADRDALQKSVDATLPKIEQLTKDVEALKKEPRQSAPRLSVVEKTGDSGAASNGAPVADVEKAIAAMSNEDKASLFIRLAQSSPQKMS